MNRDSCIVFSMPRAGTHIVMKLLMNLDYIEMVTPDPEKKWNNLVPLTNHFTYGNHSPASRCIDKFNKTGLKGIYIIRDLKDLITSQYHLYKKQGLYTHVKDLTKFLINDAPDVFNANRGWMTHSKIHVTAFELFVQQPEVEIEKICKFLNCKNTTNSDELLGLKDDHPYWRNFRKGVIGDWKNHFTEKHIKLFDKECSEVNAEIHKFIRGNTNGIINKL